MVIFNLFPWRCAAFHYQKCMMRFLLGMPILLAVIFLILAHFVLSYRLQGLSMQGEALKEQLARFNQKSMSIETENTTALIHNMKNDQRKIESLFMHLAKGYAHHICFTRIVRNKNKIIFLGQSLSIIDLSLFLQHLAMSNLFLDLQIEKIVHQQNHTIKFIFKGVEK